MSGYKYDEEGGQFFTFVLTALLALIIPYTYRVLRPKRDAGTCLSLLTPSQLKCMAGWISVGTKHGSSSG